LVEPSWGPYNDGLLLCHGSSNFTGCCGIVK
jgi:hypothetical protein